MTDRVARELAASAPPPAEPDTFFQRVVEDAPDAVLVVDGSGTVVFANRRAEVLTGYPGEELQGRPMASLLGDAVAAVGGGRAGSRRRRQVPARRGLQLRRRDGTAVPVDVTSAVAPTAVGEPLVVVALRDDSDRRDADEALRRSEARLAEAQHLAHIGSWSWDVGSDTVTWSAELHRIYGIDAGEPGVTFDTYIGRVHPDDRQRVAATVVRTVEELVPFRHRYRVVRPGGDVRWVDARGEVAEVRDGVAVRLRGTCHDITGQVIAEMGQRRAQAELGGHLRILESIARGEPLPRTLDALCREIEDRHPGAMCSVLVVDAASGTLRSVAGPSLPVTFTEAIDGLPVAEGMGACGTAAARNEVVVVEDTATDPLTQAFATLAARHGLRSVWSCPLTSASAAVIGTFAVYRSVPHAPGNDEVQAVAACAHLAAVAIERHRTEAALTRAAQVDPVTGLPNRVRFLDLVAQRLAEPGARPAVMFLDVDGFKWVNDSLGHATGDGVLVEVARRLSDCLGPEALLARFGGDEFTVLVDPAPPRRIEAAAAAMEGAFTEPFVVDGGEFFLSASIGIARRDRGSTPDSLVRDADTAMYAAKAAGRRRHVTFDAALRRRTVQRTTLEAELRRMGEEECLVHYQPLVDLRTGRWSGVEGLVRWQHPTRGLLLPGAFVPLAEETGLIVPLGLRILERVVAQGAAWQAAHPGATVAANVSAVQLADPAFAGHVADLVAAHGLAPERLVLEVTESAVMEQLETARSVLADLAASGVRIAIDDFGTAYSSIARLRDLPVVGLKVDQSFTARLGIDERVEDIVAAIVDLAHALDLEVVAEGIETPEALRILCRMGCDHGQGFLLARPVPPEDAARILAGETPVAAGIDGGAGG